MACLLFGMANAWQLKHLHSAFWGKHRVPASSGSRVEGPVRQVTVKVHDHAAARNEWLQMDVHLMKRCTKKYLGP